ncbi:MAG: histidine kinase [Inhella sp.]
MNAGATEAAPRWRAWIGALVLVEGLIAWSLDRWRFGLSWGFPQIEIQRLVLALWTLVGLHLLVAALERRPPPAWRHSLLWVLSLAALELALRSGVAAALPVLRPAAAQAVLNARQAQWIGLLVGAALALLQYGLPALGLQAWRLWRLRERAQHLAQAARLERLQTQLHPHFLFNALNSVRGLIFEDPPRAAAMLTELSQLLRASLEAGPSTQTLRTEWALCQRYLALEGLRLEQRLQLQCELPEALLDQTLPRLALLGLVENAIKHGIGARAEGGLLYVQARAQTTGWCLTVHNPCAAQSRPGLGSGLRQLREQLQALYGPAAQLHTQRRPGPFFEATLHLPLAPAAADETADR